MLRVLDTVLYKFAQQWTCVKEILGPWQGPCPSYLYLCPLSWLALIVRLWNISHTFFLCSLCQPLSSAGALPGRGQRQDTRLTNATVFSGKFWYFSESRTAECLEGRDNASKFGLALPRPALILDLLCKEKEKPCALTMRVNAWQEITVHHNVF